MSSKSIVVEKLCKAYEDTQALKDAAFEVSEGELFGLIGPDGAGKTTLIRILVTLLLADSGKALVEGLDVVKNFRKIRNRVGYMPGRFSLYQDLSVEENLTFFATIFGTSIKENYDLVKPIYAQIEPFRKRRAGALSGGMKQKLALSCALIHRPSVLFLDEPTTGVDAVSRKEFWEMLKELQKKGITILVSTPYMDEAGLCDRVALMQDSRILSIDTPEEIVNRYDKELYSVKSDNMYRLITDLRSFPETGSVFPFGQCVHYTSSTASVNMDGITRFLDDKGHTNVTIEQITPGIEDCFMELMGTGESTERKDG